MATPTPAEFLVEHPEFTGAGNTLIQAKLDLAALRTDATTWGTKWRAGVILRAAVLLAKSPHGRKMRLAKEDGSTVYDDDLRTMVRTVAAGIRAL